MFAFPHTIRQKNDLQLDGVALGKHEVLKVDWIYGFPSQIRAVVSKHVFLALAHLEDLPVDPPVDPPRVAVGNERGVDLEEDGERHVEHALCALVLGWLKYCMRRREKGRKKSGCRLYLSMWEACFKHWLSDGSFGWRHWRHQHGE